MRLKKLLTLFCFLVLSFQLLPVQQLGSMLFKSQLTEELPHVDDNEVKDSKDQLSFKKDFVFHHDQSNVHFFQASIIQYIHFSIALPSRLAGDIHTPPPNFA